MNLKPKSFLSVFAIFVVSLLISSCQEADECVDYREDSFSVNLSVENPGSSERTLEIGTVIKHKNSDKWTLTKTDTIEVKPKETSDFLVNVAMIWESYDENEIDGFSFFIKEGESYYTGFGKSESCQLEENKNLNPDSVKKDGLLKLLLKEKSENGLSTMNFYTSLESEPLLSENFTEKNMQVYQSFNNYRITFDVKLEADSLSFSPKFEGTSDGSVKFINQK